MGAVEEAAARRRRWRLGRRCRSNCARRLRERGGAESARSTGLLRGEVYVSSQVASSTAQEVRASMPGAVSPRSGAAAGRAWGRGSHGAFGADLEGPGGQDGRGVGRGLGVVRAGQPDSWSTRATRSSSYGLVMDGVRWAGRAPGRADTREGEFRRLIVPAARPRSCAAETLSAGEIAGQRPICHEGARLQATPQYGWPEHRRLPVGVGRRGRVRSSASQFSKNFFGGVSL